MKLFVWDLHGVLETGNEHGAVWVTNQILKKHGFKTRLDNEEHRKIVGLSWYKYFEYLLPDEPKKLHLLMQEESFAFSDANFKTMAKHLRPTDHSHDLLQGIHDAGHTQILISNTYPNPLASYMLALDINKFFPAGFAFAISAHDPKTKHTKAAQLKEFLKGKKFDEVICIGDSPKEIELTSVAEQAGIKAVSIQYTHPDMDFREAKPDIRTHNLLDIKKFI